MNLRKVLAGAMVGSALVLGAAGTGIGVANADPAAPAPMRPDCWPWCNGGPGNGPGNEQDWNRGNGHDDDWARSAWWANNRHDWWDDRNGAPPWGWGPPPPYQWNGGPLPQTINYWGYNETPVWDDGFHQWGFWLFGIWIPIFGVGGS